MLAKGHPALRPRRMQGVGMIEILVTVLLISFGVLAMAHLHASSFRYVKMAQFRGQATQFAFEMSDRMRSNTAAAVAGNYIYTTTYNPTRPAVAVPGCLIATACTAAEIAAIDLAEMLNVIRVSLPGGGLLVTREAAPQTNIQNIWVIWIDPDAQGNSGGDTSAVMGCPPAVPVTPTPMCLAMRTAL